ncbi:MAG TPA: WYL domain-containing protein [Acidimicrobiia bacterium]|jgi:proteasome accessory factor C|nr:WYL domain-containing protein [Acidimicrobiia bacterium]
MSRPLVGPRLQRVLALVPWILAHPGVTIAELAARFEVSERELERDLELLPMCGLPPYTADRLIDVSVIDGEVEIRLAEYFERPLRLTPAEGLALLAAGRALLAVPGSDDDGPLATALAKLDDALGAPGSLAVDVGASDQLQRLQDAEADDERVEIDYYSFARDEMTTRVIDPWRVFHAFGAWYVAAWCHRAQAERLFRVDRVRAVRATGERFDPASRADDDARDLVYRPRPEDPRVTLRLAPAAEWVVESHPHESATRADDGTWQVVLAISEPAWLERLLVALGPDATVVAPADLKELGAEAAGRLRRRYGTT